MLRLVVVCAAIALLDSAALSQAPAPAGQAPATGAAQPAFETRKVDGTDCH